MNKDDSVLTAGELRGFANSLMVVGMMLTGTLVALMGAPLAVALPVFGVFLMAFAILHMAANDLDYANAGDHLV